HALRRALVRPLPLPCCAPPPVLRSFPTRRSSDLLCPAPEAERTPLPPVRARIAVAQDAAFCFCYPESLQALREAGAECVFFSPLNRKSTRLNSSHVSISYAVFCLKKKKKIANCIA